MKILKPLFTTIIFVALLSPGGAQPLPAPPQIIPDRIAPNLNSQNPITIFRDNGDIDIGTYNKDSQSWSLFKENGGIQNGRIEPNGDIIIHEYD